MEKQELKIVDMVNKDWFTDLDSSSIWLRIYTMVRISRQEMTQKFNNPVFDLTIENIPIRIAYLALYSSMNLPKIEECFPYGDIESGMLQVPVKLTDFKLPPSCYVFFICPFKINGIHGNENLIVSVLNQAESLFSCVAGNNLLRNLVYEEENALTEKGQSSYAGSPVGVPQVCDGPFVTEANWQEVSELVSKIENLSNKEMQYRLRLSLQFFQRGKNIFNAQEKFFLYWTAITIVTESTSSMAINQKFQSMYDKDKKFVENDLHWKWAVDARNDLFKRGERLNFHMWVERYFQMLFLDLLRYEAGLGCKQHLLSYVSGAPDFRK